MFPAFALPAQGYKILLLLTLGSTCISALVPAMGYFIVEGLEQPSWKIGLYTGLVMPLTVVVNRTFGRFLDSSIPPRRLLGFSIAAYLMFSSLLASLPPFEVLILCGAPLMALANSATATTFTFGRLYALAHDLDTGRFNALLRMGVSVAWMIGPATTFTLFSQIGFRYTYLVSASIGIVWLVIWFTTVPADFRAPSATRDTETGGPTNWGLWIAALACTMFALANTLFTSVLPLFFITEIGLPGFTPGMTLTLKCLVEVFVIFSAARIAERIDARRVLLIAAALAAGVFLLMADVTTVYEAGMYALIEGVYYGLFAGVSITYVQNFIPRTPGRATAIYVNCLFIGGMIGSISMGLIASASSYQAVVYSAAGAGAAAFLLLVVTGFFFRDAP